MNSKRLLHVLGQIDNELIEQAAPTYKKPAIKVFWICTSVIASLAVVVILSIAILKSSIFLREPVDTNENKNWPPVTTTEDKLWPQKLVPDSSSTGGETAIVPKWDEQTISQQYSQVNINSVKYSSRHTEIKSEHIGHKIDVATATGYDTYTDTVYTKEVSVYSIDNISDQCAMAVQFDGQEAYYVYINPEYQPETLNDFIHDLNLVQNIEFGSVYYTWHTEDKPITTVEFVNLEDSIVWNMLLSNTTVSAIKNIDTLPLDSKMSVSVNIPLLGYENISLWVTQDGLLVTNILDTAKVFDLGTDVTEKFVNYVIDNCEGYELVYENSSGQLAE